ncbi:MAG: helix-turn-helix transcriptional regulator [Betaproteobacteria bacterium]
MTSSTLIASHLKKRREALGLTQREAAKRGGIQQRQVSALERGKDITLSTLLKLATALDVEIIPVPNETSSQIIASIEKPFLRLTQPRGPRTLLTTYGVSDSEEEEEE